MEKDVNIRDVVVVGAGPSALAAAIYTTREDIDTVLYEKGVIGGLAAITDKVDNYPGFADGVEGLKLAEEFQKQAERFGAMIDFGEVTEIRDNGRTKTVVVDGNEVETRAVLIATGSDYVRLGIPGENENFGRGVHFCATCDGAFYRDKTLIVVGGGNSAVQETIFLTRFASHIDMLVRSDFRASDVLVEELQKYIDEGKVTVHKQTTTDEILSGDSGVSGVKATKEGQPTTFMADGVFVFIGLVPNTQFVDSAKIELDPMGHVKTDLKLQTTMPGVFASGDVRSGATLQIASAVGEGATAAMSIREYLEGKLNKETK